MKKTLVSLILTIILFTAVPAQIQGCGVANAELYYPEENLYYPQEKEITCIAVCTDIWKMKVFNSDVSALLAFINEMQPRHAKLVKMASFLQVGNKEKNIIDRTVLAIIYPEEKCGCKE